MSTTTTRHRASNGDRAALTLPERAEPTTTPRIVVDGITYDHYPDDREHIANLRDELASWQAYALELLKAQHRAEPTSA